MWCLTGERAVIRLENVHKSFGETLALDDVSLWVQEQDLFGLVGPDGAGKTTLMRVVCGLIRPDSGQVYLMNHSIDRIEQVRAGLGYMPQRFSLYPDLTVMENIEFFGAMYRLSRVLIRQRAEEILSITGLEGFESRLADNLSGGMKQKLALACALVTRPRLLVLDEPTLGVDPQSRKEIWKILYRLNQEGMTVLVSTPYMDEAELCTKVALMNRGRIVGVDSPTGWKKAYPYHVLEVRLATRDPQFFQGMPGVIDYSFFGDRFHLAVHDVEQLLSVMKEYIAERGEEVRSVRQIRPSMEDVFVEFAEKGVG